MYAIRYPTVEKTIFFPLNYIKKSFSFLSMILQQNIHIHINSIFIIYHIVGPQHIEMIRSTGREDSIEN